MHTVLPSLFLHFSCSDASRVLGNEELKAGGREEGEDRGAGKGEGRRERGGGGGGE